MKLLIRTIIIVFVLTSFVGGGWYLYQKNQKKPIHYQTQSPFITDIVKKTMATGSVMPRKEIAIKPQISGIVDEVFVEAGQHVKKGDVIARVKIIPDMIVLNNAESRANKAYLEFEDMKKTYERKQGMRALITEAEFQETELRYKKAREELNAAENNLQLIKEGVTKKTGGTTNTLIRSAIEGMLLDVPIKQGYSLIESNNFNEGTTVATVADMDEMIFEGKIDESDVGKIKKGMALILSIGAIENERFDAKIEYISPKGVMENGSVQFNIRAKIELKKSFFIRAGYSANANIVLERRDQVLAINESLLQFKGDVPYVEVEMQPQQFEKREIKVGISDGINIEILEGLTEQDHIKVHNR